MPGFVGHTTANGIVLAGTTAFMWSQGWSVADIFAVDAGVAISTLILSPDMDLFVSKSMDDWGILRFFWWPYAKIVKHRDRLHVPLLGTGVRWLYTLLLLSLASVPLAILVRRIGFQVTFAGETEDVIWYLGYLLDAFLGAILADAMHFTLDVLTTGLKIRFGLHHHRERFPLARRRRFLPGGEDRPAQPHLGFQNPLPRPEGDWGEQNR